MRRTLYRPAARADIRFILRSSQRRFGVRAQRDYSALIDRALALLCENPRRPGVAPTDMVEGAFLFHLRHARQRGRAPKPPRHIIVFDYDDAALTVLRVLHDAMNIETHLRGDDE